MVDIFVGHFIGDAVD